MSSSTQLRLKKLYLVTLVVYALLGAALTVSAYAQSRSTIVPLPASETARPPSGSDDATVKEYYDYLDLQAYAAKTQTYSWQWIPVAEMYFVGGILLVVLYFFVFAWFARRTGQDLYPVEVYNGYITERGGPVDPFNWAVYAVLLLYAVFYIVMSVLFGQIY